MTVSTSNRGKLAEAKLKTYLDRLSLTASCASFRLPDAHAGSRAATLCDFIAMHEGHMLLIECKSTRHAYRLPHGNVDSAQVARMRVWQLAGAKSFVMVYHELEDVWRSATIDYFLNREGGSWDLRHIPTSDLATAFNNYAKSNNP